MLAAILVLVGLAAFSHVAPFPFLFDALTGDLTVWRVPQAPGTKEAYLTFDDGPNPRITPEILDLLKEKQVPATFFLIDDYVNQETALIVRRMFDEGHTVAQHSGDRWLMFKSPNRVIQTLQQAADRIESLAGSRPCPLFRPHAGLRSIPMLRALSRLKYKMIGWGWMTFDWVWFKKKTGEKIANQVLSHMEPGKIIVLHDGHHRNPKPDRRYNLDAAKRIIEGLQSKGYTLAGLCPGTSPPSP